MFTRYKGTEIPENYGGTAFRDVLAPPTEMKTHKPSPSYTSTRTSVSNAFKSAQMNQSIKNARAFNENSSKEAFSFPHEKNPVQYNFYEASSDETENDGGHSDSFSEENSDVINKYESDNDSEFKSSAPEKALASGAVKELFSMIEGVLKGIRGEDLLLLSVALLIFADGKSNARGALFPLALLLLYS